MTSNYSARHYVSQVLLRFGNDECIILCNSEPVSRALLKLKSLRRGSH